MKKVIVIRLENVLVRKFDVEKSFEMMIKRMEKKKISVDGLMRSYQEDLQVDWKEKRKKEMMNRYENEFEKRVIYQEGKNVLRDLLGLKKNNSLNDLRVIVVSDMGGRKVCKLLNNNGLNEDKIEVIRFGEGEIENCLNEIGVEKECFGKVVVLSNSVKDIEECEALGIKYEKCKWCNVEGIVSEEIFRVIGLRRR